MGNQLEKFRRFHITGHNQTTDWPQSRSDLISEIFDLYHFCNCTNVLKIWCWRPSILDQFDQNSDNFIQKYSHKTLFFSTMWDAIHLPGLEPETLVAVDTKPIVSYWPPMWLSTVYYWIILGILVNYNVILGNTFCTCSRCPPYWGHLIRKRRWATRNQSHPPDLLSLSTGHLSCN